MAKTRKEINKVNQKLEEKQLKLVERKTTIYDSNKIKNHYTYTLQS